MTRIWIASKIVNVEINVEDGERAQSLKKKKRIIMILRLVI